MVLDSNASAARPSGVPGNIGNMPIADPTRVIDLGDAGQYRVGAAVLNRHAVPVYRERMGALDPSIESALADYVVWVFNPHKVAWGSDNRTDR